MQLVLLPNPNLIAPKKEILDMPELQILQECSRRFPF